jgi:thiol-disulfide isomerase/thioredoxin
MASNLKTVRDLPHYKAELESAGIRLVVADFTATWCQPCQRMGPVFKEFALRYPNAVFLKIDVDECQDVAAQEGVTSMPTFFLFKAKCKVDSVRGADPNGLEAKIKQHYVPGEEDGGSGDSSLVPGQLDLTSLIAKSECECLNDDDEHPWENMLKSDDSMARSDCDEQLIVGITFNQNVKLHSLVVRAPENSGPKTIKLFANAMHGLDFDSAEKKEPTQALTLTAEDVQEGKPVALKYVKFQNVRNVTVFIKDNQGGEEQTEIKRFMFLGTPISTTNMEEFKRVAGKKGEAHF